MSSPGTFRVQEQVLNFLQGKRQVINIIGYYLFLSDEKKGLKSLENCLKRKILKTGLIETYKISEKFALEIFCPVDQRLVKNSRIGDGRKNNYFSKRCPLSHFLYQAPLTFLWIIQRKSRQYPLDHTK